MTVLLSLTVFAALALIAAGIWGLRQPGAKRKPALMVGAGLVTLLNVWIYALPAG